MEELKERIDDLETENEILKGAHTADFKELSLLRLENAKLEAELSELKEKAENYEKYMSENYTSKEKIEELEKSRDEWKSLCEEALF